MKSERRVAMSGKRVIQGIIGTSFRVIVMAIIIIYVYRMSMTAYDFGFRVFAEPAISKGEGRDVEVTVPMGKNTLEIGGILEDKGLIRDAKLFFVQEKLSAYRGRLAPGAYTLNTSMTASEMIEAMAQDSKEDDSEGESQ